jgi:hypothetical protein
MSVIAGGFRSSRDNLIVNTEIDGRSRDVYRLTPHLFEINLLRIFTGFLDKNDSLVTVNKYSMQFIAVDSF